MSTRITIAVAFVVVSACGTSSHSLAGARVVPPDIRDVEREGEGLVATTFGPFPTRTPDWLRAAGVLSLLEQVWGRAKAANPGLPKAQVALIDRAIATLEVAIPGSDQQTAAYAANSVGLACPELFAFFSSDAPTGVLRMDATFRQIGLDAHYMKLADVATDVASIRTDWANTSGSVGLRGPTCHRVGGTATVAGDIEASLARLDTAVAAGDVTTLENESDNGALEVDTLELLFDCPPDSAAPNHGLGAACKGSSACDLGQVCDPSNAGGKCAPDATNLIGTPCSTTTDCGTDPRAACNSATGDSYPGGYCFMEPCDDIQVCPPGATCVSIGGEKPGCFKSCVLDADCRTSEGYVCQLFSTQAPIGFGPSDRACAFPCTRDTDCQSPLKCDIASAKCTP